MTLPERVYGLSRTSLGKPERPNTFKSKCLFRVFLMGDCGWDQSRVFKGTQANLDLLSLKGKKNCFALDNLLLMGKLV